MKSVRDPIHEYIRFTPSERKVIDSPWFQRLRHCAQNGPTRLVYPSLLGTRFEHSLGVMDVATRILDSALGIHPVGQPPLLDSFVKTCRRDFRLLLGKEVKRKEDVLNLLRQILRMTALCHDIGHFPLSHTLERAFQDTCCTNLIPRYFPARATHELVGIEVVRQIANAPNSPLSAWMARAIILTMLTPSGLAVKYGRSALPCSRTCFQTLNGIIMGAYDADRLDYLQRDGYLSGSGFGHFDVRRFIDAMTLAKDDAEFVIIPSSHALSTVEAALVERYKLYKWVYFHHKTLFLDEITCEIGRSVFQRKDVRKQMFRPTSLKASTPDEHRLRVLEALANPRKKIPPVILFVGDHVGFPGKLCELDAGFLVSNKDTHFFDDIWFCSRCRKKGVMGKNTPFYLQTLVERSECGITVWKDWSDFTVFQDACMKSIAASAALREKVATEGIDIHAADWLKRLWKSMKQGTFPVDVLASFTKMAGKALESDGFSDVRPVVRVADWRLFGDLKRKRIVGHTGKLSYLIGHSTLLRELSDLKDEIPFYVFLAGKSEDVGRIKKSSAAMKKLSGIMASSFVNAVVKHWDLSEEIKGAWGEATAEGS